MSMALRLAHLVLPDMLASSLTQCAVRASDVPDRQPASPWSL